MHVIPFRSIDIFIYINYATICRCAKVHFYYILEFKNNQKSLKHAETKVSEFDYVT